MTFLPENDLEAALMRAAKDPAARAEFYRLLLSSSLFVIARIEGRTLSGAGNTIQPGERMQIATGEMNGKRFHPVFTSLKRLEASNPDNAEWLSLNGRALFETTKGATFVLNPGSEYGKELLVEEIAWMLAPPPAQTVKIEKPTQVMISQPSVYPRELVDALKAAFAKRPEVASAHLVQIAYSDQAPHPLIGVETTGDWASLSEEIGKVVGVVSPGVPVDAAPISRDEAQGGLSSHLLKVTPFYKRAAN